MRVDAMSRGLILFSCVFWLAGCAGRTTAPSGPVVFVDAMGHRTVVDDRSALAPPAESHRAVDKLIGEAPQSASPVVTTPAPINDDEFVPSEEFERSMNEKSGQRFYMLPDGSGRLEGVTASELLADQAVQAVTPTAEHSTLLACKPGLPPLAHLLLLDEGGRAHNLEFPVHDPTLKTQQRYAGYRLPIPPETRSVRLAGVLQKGESPDVVVLQANGGVPIAVVNNYATESIPENPFRYATVRGEMALLGSATASRELVVMEGAWARKTLDKSCRPEQGAHRSVSGKVSLEFLKGGRGATTAPAK